MIDEIPDFGETAPLTLQGSLESAVEFDDKTMFRARVQGLQGTDGAQLSTRVFSSRHPRGHAERLQEAQSSSFKRSSVASTASRRTSSTRSRTPSSSSAARRATLSPTTRLRHQAKSVRS